MWHCWLPTRVALLAPIGSSVARTVGSLWLKTTATSTSTALGLQATPSRSRVSVTRAPELPTVAHLYVLRPLSTFAFVEFDWAPRPVLSLSVKQ